MCDDRVSEAERKNATFCFLKRTRLACLYAALEGRDKFFNDDWKFFGGARAMVYLRMVMPIAPSKEYALILRLKRARNY